jgi:hypothetical protein
LGEVFSRIYDNCKNDLRIVNGILAYSFTQNSTDFISTHAHMLMDFSPMMKSHGKMVESVFFSKQQDQIHLKFIIETVWKIKSNA